MEPTVNGNIIETQICYMSVGSIVADDHSFNRQLNDVLNLNLPWLKNARKEVLTGLLRWWKLERDSRRGPVPRRLIVKKRNEYVSGSGALSPYCQVVVWWLNRRLAVTS